MNKIIIALLTLTACGTAHAASPVATTTTTAPPRACPVGSTVIVVGDSITVLAANQGLREKLTDAGYFPEVNAKFGRTIGEAPEVVAGFAQFENEQRCWVIALGTNSLPDEAAVSIPLVLQRFPIGEPIWWMRVASNGGPEINPLIPVPMIDWRPTPNELQDNGVGANGVHPTPAGSNVWIETVIDALTQASAPA